MRKHVRQLLKGRLPGQLIIQLSDHCNASCPQCGMRKENRFERSKLDVDTVKRTIDAAAEKGIDIVSFTGGEPLLYLDELTELIEHAGSAGIKYIRTGTNGFIFRDPDNPDFQQRVGRVAEKLAATPLRNFWISVDSAVPQEHERIRGFDGVMRGIEKALPIFHDVGIYPAANLGINRHLAGSMTSDMTRLPSYNGEYAGMFYDVYRKAFADFYSFVKNLGFTTVNMCYPMSGKESTDEKGNLECVYTAASTESMVSFDKEEKSMLFKALLDVIPHFRNEIRIFTPRVSLYALHRKYAGISSEEYPCRGGLDFFFIDAQKGHTFPCGYRGDEDLGPLWEVDNEDIEKKNAGRNCLRCDWECFRDPSEMAGYILETVKTPSRALKKLFNDTTYLRILWEDILYYRKCNWFDGRSASQQTFSMKKNTLPSIAIEH